MKNIMLTLQRVLGTLTVISAIMFVFTLIAGNYMSYDNLLFDTFYVLMWVGLGATPLFAVLWFVSKIKADDAFAEENRIKWEEQRKIQEAKKEQQKAEAKKAYETISEIWEYGDKTMRAVSSSSTGLFMHIKLSYSASKTNPWTISIKSPNKNTFSNFKAKRNGDSLVGTSGNKVLVITKGQIVYGDLTFFFNPENERVKKVDELMKRLLNGRKIEAYREEHFRTGANNFDALPKFHFTFTDNGIKCDEINYPKKQIDDLIEYIIKDESLKLSLDDYRFHIKNKALIGKCSIDEYEEESKSFVKSLESYTKRKTLDVVPISASETTIYFKHKIYSKKNNEYNFRNIVIPYMQKVYSRKNNDNIYFVSIVDNMILIKINEDAFVSVLDEDKTA